MSNEFGGDFAAIYPHDHLAKKLFSRCLTSLKETDNAYHLDFMVATTELPLVDDKPVESSTEYDSYHDIDVDESLEPGYFVLSLHGNCLPEFPHLGWRIGRGASKFKNRGVDVLLARPGDPLGKSLMSVHFTLRMSQDCGILMLCTPKTLKSRLEININGRWEPLGPEEERLMYLRSTILRAGRCEYELVYTIGDEHREVFLEKRNYFLDKTVKAKSKAFLRSSYFPGDDITICGRYLHGTTLGNGTFGWVSSGIDSHTGKLIAIKEVYIKAARSWPEVENEMRIGMLVQVSHSTTNVKIRTILRRLSRG